MRARNFYFSAATTIFLGACVTSRDIADRQDYVDPTNVMTVEAGGNPGEPKTVANPTNPAQSEEALREIDVVKGRWEEAQHRASTLEAENQQLKDEIAKLKTPPPPPPAPTESTAAVPAPLENSPTKKSGAPFLWESGNKDLKAGESKSALVAFEEIVKTYPKDPRAYYAALAIPMVQYRMENYKEAALGFNQIIDKYPKRSETAYAWFGQGAAFFKLNQKDDSKLFYEEVGKRFPKSDAAATAKKFAARKGGGAPRDLFIQFPTWNEKASAK